MLGSSKTVLESLHLHRYPRVLQGQEMRTIVGSFVEIEMESNQKPLVWGSIEDNIKQDGGASKGRLASKHWMLQCRKDLACVDSFSSIGRDVQQFNVPSMVQNMERFQGLKMAQNKFQDQESGISDHPGMKLHLSNPWSILSINKSNELTDSNLKPCRSSNISHKQTDAIK